MKEAQISFTAIYLKASEGYVGFIEELPAVNFHGRTLNEVRDTLRKLAARLFAEHRQSGALAEASHVLRESFSVQIPNAP